MKALKTILLYAGLLLIALLMIGPFLWLFSTALKGPAENLFAFPPQLVPEQPTLANLFAVWEAVPFGQYTLNSILVSLLSVVANVLLAALAAYPLARMRFPGKGVMFMAILTTMMVPFQVIMIPLFLVCLKLGLHDSLAGVVLPTAVSAFGIFLLRQAYMAIPKELEEAALIDGCGPLMLWWRIMLPLIKPAVATLAIFTFVGAWGDFLWPLIIIKDPNWYTLPVGLSMLAGTFSGNWRLVAAGSVLATVPVVIVFILLQRYFIAEGTAGAVKG
jgi:putative chitobiose transport system permease protein